MISKCLADEVVPNVNVFGPRMKTDETELEANFAASWLSLNNTLNNVFSRALEAQLYQETNQVDCFLSSIDEAHVLCFD